MTEAASMSDLQLLPLDQPLLPDTLARAFDITQPGTSAKSGPGSGPSSQPAPRQPAAAGATSAFAAPRQTGAAPPRAAPVDRQAGLGVGVAGQNSWSTMTAAFQAQQQRQQQQALAQAQAQAQGQPPPGTSHAVAAAAAAAAMPAASAQFPLGGLAVQSAPFPGHPGEAFLPAAAPGALPYNPYHSFPLMGAVGMPQQPFNPYLNVMPPFAGAPGVPGAMPGVGLPPGAAPSDYLAGAMQVHPLYAQLPGQMPGQMPGQLPGLMPGMPPPASHAFGAPAEQAEQKPGAAPDQQLQQQQQGTSPTAAQAAAQGKVAMTKKPRVAWTPDLHARFVKAVTALGVDTAVPKQIMLAMNVEGLTRENVASHLQKFRMQLRRDKD